MAGPSVVVRVLADLKGLTGSFGAAGKTAESAAGRAHAAFGGVLGTLNQSGVLGPFGATLATLDGAMQGLANHGKTVGGIMLGAGGAVAGVGLGLQALGSREQASHQQLQAAIGATGKDYEDFASSIEKSVGHMEHFGFTAGQTNDALRVLTQATHDPQKALDLLGTAANVAKAKHEDLNTAATQIGRVFNGNTKLLKEYGIVVDKNTHLTADGKTATQALAEVTAGQASAAANTFSGRLDAIKAKVEDTVAAFGQKYGPAITAFGAVMTGLGAVIEIVTALNEALAASEYLSLGPILLIIAAVVALGALIYVLYRNWDTIWSAIKAVVEVVWNWIKDNWPLLLAIITGPVGVAVYLITRYWDQIKKGASDVWQWIQDGWNALFGFFSDLVGGAADIFGKVGDAIANAFKAAFNFVARVWNDTVGQLNFHIPKWVPGIGGESFGVPRIPTFAEGGIVTGPTLALVGERGPEAIVPLGRGLGPAVNIEQAVFTGGADLDLLMAKVAFATTAGRL